MARKSNGPWPRKGRGYYVWHQNELVNLHTKDEGEAKRRWHLMLATGQRPRPTEPVPAEAKRLSAAGLIGPYNGIHDVIRRGDLADRVVTLMLHRIRDEHRQEERLLVERFEQIRPRVFGAFLHGLSEALREELADLLR